MMPLTLDGAACSWYALLLTRSPRGIFPWGFSFWGGFPREVLDDRRRIPAELRGLHAPQFRLPPPGPCPPRLALPAPGSAAGGAGALHRGAEALRRRQRPSRPVS